MQLLIVRHAIACERSAKRWPDDGERPLSARGAARARKAAAGLAKLAPRPALVLVSPLLRTRQTAAILSECAEWPRAVACPELAPGAAPEALLAVVRRRRERCVAIVGHEPGLGRLIGLTLAPGARARSFALKKMGVALVAFPAAARAGEARLEWLVPPKALRAAR